jgi:hypothetical protein
MMGWFWRSLGYRDHSRSDAAFNNAMQASGDLIDHMREASNSTDAFRAMMADIWAQHQNITFMTMMYETVQEMKSGADQQGGHDGDHKDA